MVESDEKWVINIIKSEPQIIDKQTFFYIENNEINRNMLTYSANKNKIKSQSNNKLITYNKDINLQNNVANELIDKQITESMKRGKSFDDIWNELNISKYIQTKPNK